MKDRPPARGFAESWISPITNYDPDRNSLDSYSLAIAEIRKRIEAGEKIDRTKYGFSK